jgi:DHA1 family bicyclomycin/chloramphenicol resistance-like MFS transporter
MQDSPLKTDRALRPAEEAERPHAAPGHPTGITAGLLIVLALLSVIAPFATDLYLPAFPVMTDDLGTSATGVQLTLTSFLVGVALGQLVFGPLSDRFGRKGPLVVGAALCVAASIAAAIAPTVGILIAARFIQGASGAAGMVIGRAIISDLATGKAAARAFSLTMIVGGVAPVLAPVIGSVLVEPIGWRGILWVVAIIAALMLIAVLLVVRESHSKQRRTELQQSLTGREKPSIALRSQIYLGNTFAFAFAFAVLMAYISASPFLYQTMMGLSTVQYGLLFGANALALTIVSGISARLSATLPVGRLLGLGLGLVLVAAAAMMVLVVIDVSPIWLTVPVFVAVASLGLVLGNATSLALAAVPRAAGLGSAVLGALQFGLGAVVSPLVGIRGEDTAFPLAVIMLVSAVIAVVAFAVGNLPQRSHTRAAFSPR